VRRAIVCYRTQQAEIARLREIVARHERLGVRRFRESEARHRLVGTTVWADNVHLRRIVAQLHAQMQRQATIIESLKQLLRAQEVRV